MDEIGVNGLRVHTLIGFSPHEINKPQEVNITIQMMLSVNKAGIDDRVEDSTDYKKVTKDIIALVENKRYNLIEAIATDVARICVVYHDVPRVRVTVTKPGSLRFADSPHVTIVRSSEDFDYQDVHVSIGSNINPLENIPKAIEILIKTKSELVKLSKAFVTPPEKYYDQADFVNMAALIRTRLDPRGLKLFLCEIEKQLGRTRDTTQNTPAATQIDLDIALWEDKVLEYNLVIGGDTKSWNIPEPDITEYAYVIVPLADLSPLFVHPTRKQTLKTLAQEITGKEQFSTVFPTVSLRVESPVGGSNGSAVINGELANTSGVHGTNPVALITGAAKGIGAAIARRLHSAGYNIVVHCNTSRREASELVKDLNSVRVNSARCVQADLQIDVQKTAEQLIRDTLASWARLDALVNNASIFQPTILGNINEEIWNGLIQTNLTAPFFLSQAAYPALKTSRGCIVNLTDIFATRPRTDYSVYCISKAGLHMSTLTMAKDFAPHVRVNGISPGAIEKPEKNGAVDLNSMKQIVKKVPLQKVGNTGDIASAVEYLVCHGKYVTGHVLNVDGGRILNL